MDISTSSGTVTIVGTIKSVSDFQEIKTVIDGVAREHRNIRLNIKDSLSITSSVIGYLNKLVLKDNIAINMTDGNASI